VLEVENFCADVVSLPVKTAPATMAIMTAAIEPIQKDFIVVPSQNSAPG
jgi:hypothetical protein